ncbi:helical backbone metal receptor [Parasegetibacter sp. NRK P23]|uniref:helical backbone metal receptor n=1 Tax=Parasegetibacter sp. NRK P23 TaxID=2942999 RepID=UPI00204475AC|nr:helical backbone metal receptor [Parasegetibacter sp. NRK P23]MCM5528480.1 helical backbone metal receptor [Parasegetibacter sp. NRK P23]
MAISTDQLGRTVLIPAPPQKIISLVPSITELLYALGLEDRIAGITRYCIFPDHLLREKTVVGGTKKTVPERIHAIAPDLIIASKEENIQAEVEAYAQQYPVWVSDVTCLEDALQLIQSIGQFTGTMSAATQMIETIQARFKTIPAIQPLKGAYLIWKDPVMTIGNDTFIHDMMRIAGIRNVFGAEKRYPVTTPEAIAALSPDVILLSSEPYPFRAEHITWLKETLGDIPVHLVDGTYFSWYGSRLLDAPAYFRSDILPIINRKE